jgi:hypothetical protein
MQPKAGVSGGKGRLGLIVPVAESVYDAQEVVEVRLNLYVVFSEVGVLCCVVYFLEVAVT